MKKYLSVLLVLVCSFMMISCGSQKNEAEVVEDETIVAEADAENLEGEDAESSDEDVEEHDVEANDTAVTAVAEETSKYVSDEEITRLSTEKYGENSRLEYIYYDLEWEDLDPESEAMSQYVRYIWYYENLGYSWDKYFRKYKTCQDAVDALQEDVSLALDVTVNRQALAAVPDGGDVVGSDYCVYYYHGKKAGKGHSYKMDPRTREITYASPENPGIARAGTPEANWLEKMGYHVLSTGVATKPFMDEKYAKKYPWPFENEQWNYETHQWEKIAQ